MRRHLSILTVLVALGAPSSWPAASEPTDKEIYEFSDVPLETTIKHPDWFKDDIFLDLGDDIREAADAGKTGIIVYFGQQRCPYCQKLMKINFGLSDIVEYTRAHFDVVPIDIWSIEEVTTPDGRTLTQREYAIALNTNFTPSLVFYNTQGKMAFRLRGYYPPYQFRAALEYVVDGFYHSETFASYLERGDHSRIFEAGDLNEEDFFESPPYMLDRSHFPADKPLAVFFEQADCHACDVLHTGPLRKESVQQLLASMSSVQLDMWSDTPVITPSGERTTAKGWAKALGLFYAPTLIFFDEKGKEIIRVDSVVRLIRLSNVLKYISSGAYREYPDLQSWRASQDL